jgi:hypothetical protein
MCSIQKAKFYTLLTEVRRVPRLMGIVLNGHRLKYSLKRATPSLRDRVVRLVQGLGADDKFQQARELQAAHGG